MNNNVTLLCKEIEGIEFELMVDTKLPKNSFGGTPCLLINGEPHLIYDVDVVDVIRTINNANNLIYIKKGVKELWCEETITETCNRFEKEYGLI